MTVSAAGQDLRLDVTTKKRGLLFLFSFHKKNTAKTEDQELPSPIPFLSREGR
jgi:hypothetical protein